MRKADKGEKIQEKKENNDIVASLQTERHLTATPTTCANIIYLFRGKI